MKKPCPPCHGECNQGRDCPNAFNDEETSFFEIWLLWIMTTVCLAFLAGLVGFVYVLFRGF